MSNQQYYKSTPQAVSLIEFADSNSPAVISASSLPKVNMKWIPSCDYEYLETKITPFYTGWRRIVHRAFPSLSKWLGMTAYTWKVEYIFKVLPKACTFLQNDK